MAPSSHMILVGVALLSVIGAHRGWAGWQDVQMEWPAQELDCRHFDPHTHWPGGILNREEFVAVFANGDRDMFERLRTDPLRSQLLRSERVWPVTKELLRCNDDPDDPLEPTEVQTALDWMLAASEYTDWDSAYAVRSLFVDSVLGNQCQNWDLLRRFKTRLGTALDQHRIAFSEQSVSMSDIDNCWADVDTAFPGPQVRFLAQLTNPLIAAVDADGSRWLKQKPRASGQGVTCEPVTAAQPADQRARNELTKMRQRLPDLLERASVVGVDVLGPEGDCVTERGMENFRELIDVVFRAAQQNQKRLVVRAHVAEGYPIWRPQQNAREEGTCREVLDPRKTERLVAMEFRNRLPLHYAVAKDNLDRLLNAVSAYRKNLPPRSRFDSYVRIRFGHATHARQDQAERMKSLKIEADANLTSNIVTGALIVKPLEMPGQRHCERSTLFRPAGLLQPLSDRRCFGSTVLEEHSLRHLLDAGVRVMLGTDGPGIEHSSFRQDKYLAGLILRSYAKTTPADGRKILARNAWCHVQWLMGRPGDPDPCPQG